MRLSRSGLKPLHWASGELQRELGGILPQHLSIGRPTPTGHQQCSELLVTMKLGNVRGRSPRQQRRRAAPWTRACPCRRRARGPSSRGAAAAAPPGHRWAAPARTCPLSALYLCCLSPCFSPPSTPAHSVACNTHQYDMGTSSPPGREDVPCSRNISPSIIAKALVTCQLSHCCLPLHPRLGCSRLLTEGRDGKLAMLRPADWYFCRSAAVKGVLELLNMFARFCKLTACESLLLPCMLANGDGRPGACAPQAELTSDTAVATIGLHRDASCMPVSDDDYRDC